MNNSDQGNENENEMNNNYDTFDFMYEFEDNLSFDSFSSMFDNAPDSNHAFKFDQSGPSENFPPLFPISDDQVNIGGGNSTVPGECDKSHGMNNENAIEINDAAAPSTGKTIKGPPPEGSSSGGRNQKGKGSLSKNYSAERRRRAKVNQQMMSLRSVVPKITKLDRASTLGDAIDHIKHLSDKINKLKLELESAPSGVAPAATLEEVSQHPTRIEVRKREGGIVTIHMRCSLRPGLPHSIAKTLRNLGLEIQDAVFNCLDGFTLDLYRAQQSTDVTEDQIKAMLLETVRNHGVV